MTGLKKVVSFMMSIFFVFGVFMPGAEKVHAGFEDNNQTIAEERAIQNKAVKKTFHYPVTINSANATATVAFDVVGYYQIDVASGAIIKGYDQKVENCRFVVSPPSSSNIHSWRIEVLESTANPIVNSGDQITFSGTVKLAVIELHGWVEQNRTILSAPYSLVHHA